MTRDLAVVLGLLAVTIVLFARDRPRMDAVALIVMTVLPFTGVITMTEALAGFADPNVVLIAALFVLGDGLVRTGVARRVGDWVAVKAGASETRLIPLLMIVVCGLGATMSSTAVAAIFIPVVLRIARNTGIAPGRLMMPVSAAALVSGMMTLIATPPNLVVNAELIRAGVPGFQFFSFTPFGIPVLAVAIGWMLYARRWLPANDGMERRKGRSRPNFAEWIESYGLAGRAHRLMVGHHSPLVDRRLDEFNLRSTAGANVVAIQRGRFLIHPTAITRARPGDILLVDLFGEGADVEALRTMYVLEELPLKAAFFADQSQEIGMAEVIVPAESELVGDTVADVGFRGRFGLTVLGLRRGVTARAGIKDLEMKVGDTLLVIGPWKSIRNLQRDDDGDLVVLGMPVEYDDVLPVQGRSTHAIVILGFVVALMITGLIPNVQAALIGCLLMGALGCVNLDSAYRSIDWKTVILIVGMLPFSLALQRTGGVGLATDALMSVAGGAGVRALLATLFLLTSLMGMFISNTATAVLMAPVAIGVAGHLGASPWPFAMIVALAASAAFMTPVSSPVNTLVVTPGGYRFVDFVRVGVPLMLLVMVVSVLMVPLLLPL